MISGKSVIRQPFKTIIFFILIGTKYSETKDIETNGAMHKSILRTSYNS